MQHPPTQEATDKIREAGFLIEKLRFLIKSKYCNKFPFIQNPSKQKA